MPSDEATFGGSHSMRENYEKVGKDACKYVYKHFCVTHTHTHTHTRAHAHTLARARAHPRRRARAHSHTQVHTHPYVTYRVS